MKGVSAHHQVPTLDQLGLSKFAIHAKAEHADFLTQERVVHRTHARCVALFDVDGTLVIPYVMRLWGLFCQENDIGNTEARNRLASVLEAMDHLPVHKKALDTLHPENDAGQPSGYAGLIDEYAETYAAMLEGYLINDIKRIGAAWSMKYLTQDAPGNVFPFALAVMHFLKKVGVEPALITGAPAEVIGGFRRYLEVVAAYALELETKGGIYTGGVKNNTGGGKAKDKWSRAIQRQGHAVVLGVGDSVADFALAHAALSGERDLVCGTAIFVEPNEGTRVHMIGELGLAQHQGRLQIIARDTDAQQGVAVIRGLIRQVVGSKRGTRRLNGDRWNSLIRQYPTLMNIRRALADMDTKEVTTRS